MIQQPQVAHSGGGSGDPLVALIGAAMDERGKTNPKDTTNGQTNTAGPSYRVGGRIRVGLTRGKGLKQP